MSLFLDIKKSFKDFNLKVKCETDQKIIGILGASGSGKSMTLRCIAGLISPDQGRIVLNDRVLFDSNRHINIPVQERGIGFVFQNYALFPNLTVEENIAFGLKKLSKNERNHKVKNKIEMMQLEGLEDRYPHQISGGQQQRTALARALVTEPSCLLLDEPFSALDHYIRAQLEKEMIETLDSFKGITLYVTHNLEECYRVSQDILVLDKGQTTAFSSRQRLFELPPNTQAARLTGCSNVSRIKIIDQETVQAIDWHCTLKLEKRNLDPALDLTQLKYLGIRDHHLTITDHPQDENTLPCWLTQSIETPNKVTLYLNLSHKNPKGYHLQTEVSKETYENIKNYRAWYVHIKPEYLFLMNN